MPRPKPLPIPFPSGAYFPGTYASNVGGLSLPQKQELLYEVAKGSEGGRETLESWTRKDLLQLLCLEMGKERKYTGVSKGKMVEHLLRLVSTKDVGEDMISPGPVSTTYPFASQSPTRRQRKGGRPSRFPSVSAVPVSVDAKVPVSVDAKGPELSSLCQNTACRAQLLPGVSFCKRCSCCICRKFDDNKDPSLWIVCTAELSSGEKNCGLSCHLECALNNGMAGVITDGSKIVLDGSYRCGPCGRINSLIGCWKKQLVIAKDARRVDILCQRLFLSHKLLSGTYKFRTVHEIVDKAIKKLEAEVGSITEGSAKLARGIVNRLSSGADVQKLICMALDKAAGLEEVPTVNSHHGCLNLQEKQPGRPCIIEFNEISSCSVLVTVKSASHIFGEPVIGYKLWHRKASDASYPDIPTCIIRRNLGSALISRLQACSEYVFCVVPFSERGIGEYAEACCFTGSIEISKRSAQLRQPIDSLVNRQHEKVSYDLNDRNEDLCNGFGSNFKVRNLGKVLHSVWGQEYQSADVVEGIFRSSGAMRNLDSDKGNEASKGEHVSPALNVLLSPGADASSVEDGICKPSHNAMQCDLNTTADLNSGLEEGRVTVEVGLSAPAIKACSRKDSSGVLQGCDVMQSPQGLLVHAKVTELDDASGPGNSQTSRKEETDTVSPDVSDSLQAHGTNELNDTVGETRRTDDLESNGHGENWAVQVRTAGAAVRTEPQTAILRKRTVGGLERGDSCYGIANGCGGTSAGAPLCAAKSYELCVKIIRWLECEGHLKAAFRMKFLTWFSLRASDHEKRVVSVFIDTLQDNPASLAGQLVDTFSDIISSKRHQMVANGFCNKLWH